MPAGVFQVPEVSVQEAAAAWRNGAVLLDVREPFELATCRVEPCLHIPMREIPARLAEIPADKPVLVLCHVGARSARVTQFLLGQGRSDVVNVAGGIEAWAREIDQSLARY